MNVSGVYRRGKVTLDQRVDWPEGTHVQVVCEPAQDGGAPEVCVDGAAWQDSPEAIEQWNEWVDSLEPVLSGEDLQRFDRELRSAREEQNRLLPKWQEKIDHLLL